MRQSLQRSGMGSWQAKSCSSSSLQKPMEFCSASIQRDAVRICKHNATQFCLHAWPGNIFHGSLAGFFALVLAILPIQTVGTCQLPITFPKGTAPSGLTIGPGNSLVVVSDSGTVQFVDLADMTVRQDASLNDKYTDSYGWFDLEGVAMTNPESTFVYLGMENKAAILEYEWHSSMRIFRRFDLPGFERTGNRGMQSLTWVPTTASRHQGYFYVGSQLTGHVFIYEVPLLDENAPEAAARLVDIWTPLKGDFMIAGLSFSSDHIFVNYDDGNSNHVLIYPILTNGLPGELREQYQVDVTDAEGMAVRKISEDTWEVFFSSDSRKAVFAYAFKFITGFELHSHCSRLMQGIPSSATFSVRANTVLSLILLMVAFLNTR